MASLRAKVQSLQVDLDNSEAVQRDFVKLSQSLQVTTNASVPIETQSREVTDDQNKGDRDPEK